MFEMTSFLEAASGFFETFELGESSLQSFVDTHLTRFFHAIASFLAALMSIISITPSPRSAASTYIGESLNWATAGTSRQLKKLILSLIHI